MDANQLALPSNVYIIYQQSQLFNQQRNGHRMRKRSSVIHYR